MTKRSTLKRKAKRLLNEIRGILKLSSYEPTKAELKFLRSNSWEARMTSHPRNYPLQQYGVSRGDAYFIIGLIEAYCKLDEKTKS